MKKRLTPRQKKELAYQKDHYVSAGESRHAFRNNWPKKKARLNQKHRRRATQVLEQVKKPGDVESISDSPREVTAEELRKIHPKDKLFKCGVYSLADYVKRSQDARGERAKKTLDERARMHAEYSQLIEQVEREPESQKAREFLNGISTHSWDLRRFLKQNPAWKPRLLKALSQIKKSAAKAQLKRDTKEAERQRVRNLQASKLPLI